MSINMRIIEAVKDNPSIYKGQSSLDERSRFWKQWADDWRTSERLLKSRWHFLVTNYKRALKEQKYFQYADALEFLKPYVIVHKTEQQIERRASPEMVQPEFVITEKDIETESDPEEYVFLEVETLEGSVEGEEERIVEMNEAEETKDEDADTATNEAQPMEPHVEPPHSAAKQEEHDIKEELDMAWNAKPPSDVREIKKGFIFCQISQLCKEIDTVTENTISKFEVSKGNKSSSANADADDKASNQHERCEDVIFGELIVAMLKRMPEDKKRSIKKEIMNLLFT